MGRPPEPVPADKVEEICEWIANGNTLRSWCRQPGNPNWTTIYRWMEKDENFAHRLARARDIGQDAIAEDTLEIIDTFPVEAVSENSSRLDSGHVTWLRNRVDQRMKLLKVWNPAKWGEKVDVNHNGGVSLHVTSGVPDDE